MTVLKYWDQTSGAYHTVSGPPGPAGPQGLIAEAPTDGQVYGRQGSTASWIAALPLTGGTLTGVGTPGVGGTLVIDGPGGTERTIESTTTGVGRWRVIMADSVSEGAGNVGSDFWIQALDNTGAFLMNPFHIVRSSGYVTLGGDLSVNGNIDGGLRFGYSVGAAVDDLTNHISLYGAGTSGSGSYGFSVTGGTLNLVAGGAAMIQLYNPSSEVLIGGNTLIGTAANGIQLQVSGASAWYRSLVQGVRDWYMGGNTDGAYYIYDASAPATRFLIDTSGNTTIYQSLTVGGNMTCNNAVIGHGDAGVQCITAGGNARFYTYGGWVWYFGSISDGTFQFYSASAGWASLILETDGSVHCNYALWVGGASTLNGTVSCNAISCSTINTNGNTITTGYISAAYMDLSNGAGIGFAQQGGGSRKSFTSTGTQLTHYINGGAAGSWNFNAPSDERIKRNIADAEGDALAELRKVRLISYDEDFFQKAHLSYGFSAQQLLTCVPEAVAKNEYVHGEEDERPNPVDDGIMLNLDIIPLLARCVGAIQQMAARLETAEAALQRLNGGTHGLH